MFALDAFDECDAFNASLYFQKKRMGWGCKHFFKFPLGKEDETDPSDASIKFDSGCTDYHHGVFLSMLARRQKIWPRQSILVD